MFVSKKKYDELMEEKQFAETSLCETSRALFDANNRIEELQNKMLAICKITEGDIHET